MAQLTICEISQLRPGKNASQIASAQSPRNGQGVPPHAACGACGEQIAAHDLSKTQDCVIVMFHQTTLSCDRTLDRHFKTRQRVCSCWTENVHKFRQPISDADWKWSSPAFHIHHFQSLFVQIKFVFKEPMTNFKVMCGN
jgi:hypothetical protein